METDKNNFKEYASNAIKESIITLDDNKTIIEYYGDSNKCNIYSYFSSQIKGDILYDSTDEMDECTLIGNIADAGLESIFEDAREETFSRWFKDKINDIDENEIIYLQDDDLVITHDYDTDDEGNEYILCSFFEKDGKHPIVVDSCTVTEGNSLFNYVYYTLMNEYSIQDIKKAALFCGIKYLYVAHDGGENYTHFYFE